MSKVLISFRHLLLVLILIVMVVSSAISVVYAKYSSRKYFVELEQVRKQKDAEDMKWSNLQLEISTQATQSRVTRLAHNLNMKSPAGNERVVIKE